MCSSAFTSANVFLWRTRTPDPGPWAGQSGIVPGAVFLGRIRSHRGLRCSMGDPDREAERSIDADHRMIQVVFFDGRLDLLLQRLVRSLERCIHGHADDLFGVRRQFRRNVL